MIAELKLKGVQLTESCDEDLPHIITDVETTVATTQDVTVVPSIHQALGEKDLLPQQHLVDQAYTISTTTFYLFCFPPRPKLESNSTPLAEDDGWVITLVYDAECDSYAHRRYRTDIVILDGKCLSQGPIARLHLKHHIPYGLHGSFVPDF
jgi:hypothetical protein